MTNPVAVPGARRAHKPVPRGIARSGPAILSYGFRPFFLLAGIFALLDMVLWIGALSGNWSVGGSAGPIAWHAHEMLFGYGAAALCGFLLTAVPNWTGRLPVSGRPLLALVIVWLAGRAAMLFPSLLGESVAAAIDVSFLLGLAAIIAREVIAGRNYQNLRVAGVVTALGLLNLAFHATTLLGWDPGGIVRATVGMFSLLIGLIGGRIIPSFTRNYLARIGETRLPSPIDRLDRISLAPVLLAIITWAVAPDTLATTLLAATAALSQAWRLSRWRTVPALAEPLLAMLHIAFVFVPLGWLGVALSSLGLLSPASAIHLLTVGAIGGMTLAVMFRAARGHTGRPLKASGLAIASFGCLLLAALLRPAAEVFPEAYHPILTMSAAAWIAAFTLFLAEYAPILLGPSLGSKASRPAP
ncbi:MAG TPA: NnrS family protein [Devosia sp.]|nr:NnrS family protein [Devosia sp.]